MDSTAQTIIQLVVALLAVLLAVRILLSLPGWIRRGRRPEARSILVVGVGGGGGNAVNRMVDAGIPGVGFIVFNTDAQALRESGASMRIRIGDAITHGLGSGGDPAVGRRAAEEDAEKIARALAGADLVFVTAGLGGGTGSGAAPIVAAKAREGGALTIAVVTKPFDFEGTRRREIADEAAVRLQTAVDALITVPNDRVSAVVHEDAAALEAFQVVDDVLLQAVQGIVDLLLRPGLINLDFADVRAVMHGAGPALIGLGRGTGEDRAADAARRAISSPLLEASIEGARGILFHVSGPPDLRLQEVRAAAEIIRSSADLGANVIFGASFSPDVDDVMITLIATGLDDQKAAMPEPEAAPQPEAAVPEPGAAMPEPDAAPLVPRRLRTSTPHVVAHADVPAARRQATTAPVKVDDVDATIAEDDTELPTFLRREGPPSADVG